MRKLLIGLIITIPLFVSGQFSLTDEAKNELIELVRDLYEIEVNIEFNISSKNLKSTVEDMSDGEKYDEAYLNDLMKKIETDSLNPIHLNNIAGYYSKKKSELAHQYYSKALDHIDIKYLSNDSAYFYSFRALLKSNLGDTTAVIDFERSVKINPNDSISMFFYPLVLISKGKYENARELIKVMLNADVKNVSLPYLYLTISEIFESFQNILTLINEDKDFKTESVNKNYNDIVNYTLMDEYLTKFQGNREIENCRIMADLLGLFYKIILFEQDSNHKLILNYTDFEINKIHEIISKLIELKNQKQLNEYTADRCLGYAYFMTGEWEKAIDYFNKAIAVFPIEKKEEYFNPAECYDAIIAITYQQSDTVSFRTALNSKIAIEADEENTINELTLLAFDYYQSGDLVTAKEYCKKIRQINSENFDALRLLSHIYFLNRFPVSAQFYGENASNYVRNDLDYYNLVMQFSIYQIYNGDFDTATENIEIAKVIKGDDDCPLCDKLVQIIENNK